MSFDYIFKLSNEFNDLINATKSFEYNLTFRDYYIYCVIYPFIENGT